MALSLFDKYGGFGPVSKIVMAFYDEAIDSDIIGPYFEDTDMRQLVDHQTKFIASVMGGPASYSDDVLRRVHDGLNITQVAFNEMTRLLRETLIAFELKEEDVDLIMFEIESKANLIISGRDK